MNYETELEEVMSNLRAAVIQLTATHRGDTRVLRDAAKNYYAAALCDVEDFIDVWSQPLTNE